ncbi:hypothetical protein LAZ67_10001409, partial [Cordylochernes scorpioides]
MYDQLESHLKSLESLGVNVQQNAYFLYPMVESSLPEDLLRTWQRSALAGYDVEDGELPPTVDKILTSLLEFMRKEVKREQRLGYIRDGLRESSRMRTNGHDVTRMHAAEVKSKTERVDPRCIICRGGHWIQHCPKWRAMPVTQRTGELRSLGACFDCLRLGHYARNCRRSKHYPRWRDRHSGFQQQPRIKPQNSLEKKMENTGLEDKVIPVNEQEVAYTGMHVRTAIPRALLATALVRVMNNRGERMMVRGKMLYEKYDTIFEEWEKEKFIEEVEDKLEECSYLPHRPVLKDSHTTPIRPVFDASCKKKGLPSLNKCLEKGDNLIELIPDLLLRFRLGKYGIIADIRKAFLQIQVREEDREFLRFLWWKNDQKTLKFYRHCRVVLGLTSRPFLLAATIKYHLSLPQFQDNRCAELIARSVYVDNCILSLSSTHDVKIFIKESSDIMMQAKFELRDWMWNEPGITEQDPESILGMKWYLQTDTIAINVQSLKNIDEEKSITKRSILSACHRIFDPIQFTCPATIKIKKMVQDAWKENKSWDEPLNEDRRVEFIKWRKQALELDQIKIPRWILPIKGRTTLHVFCDASAIAYAKVIFMRIENASVIVVRFVEARNRLATIKRITIPRLELLACLIGARLLVHVLENLEESPEKIQCWTDSSHALYWIQQQENWAQFVSNRVKEITTLTKSEDWNHVAGEHNPADLPSRGESPSKFTKSGWWEGPKWLQEKKEDWPVSKPSEYKGDIISQEKLDSAEKSLVKIIQSESIGEEDPKMKQLHTFQDKEGLWRVKTRIVNRNDDELFRLPILIPTNHPVTELIVKSVHEKMYHCGAQTLRSVLREKFWIPKARQLVRYVIHKCPRCRRFETKRVDVPEASLPQNRVRDVAVFEVTGIDLGGPLYLEDGKKVWFVIFTCGVYRAVHLKLVTSLSTEALVGAVERFVARRGCPAVYQIMDDLVGLRNELYRVNFGVKWKLNPPAAPWWGEMVTILENCERVINARPLTYIAEDNDDLVPLTPEMFLREPRTEGEIDLNEFRCNFVKSYEKRKRLLKEFRKRFRSEYLGLLVHHDNRKKQRQLKVGDIVLVEVENRKQINWPMGKITKVFPGTDNVRRLVEVKTKSGFMKRAVQRLFPLEVPSEDVEQSDGELKPAEDEIVREKTSGVESASVQDKTTPVK